MENIDSDKLQQFSLQTGNMVASGFNCAISLIGDRLNLYKSLSEIGPCDSHRLASHLALSERWVREWLHHQACLNQILFHEESGTFELSAEAFAVLVDENHPAYLMGAYDTVGAVFPAIERVEEAFRSGLGMNYDDHGPSCACGIERMGAYSKQFRLVPEILPLVPGINRKLNEGTKVADIGCGGALATIAMAAAFPRSSFYGFDISENALNRARENAAEAKVSNVVFLNPTESPLPQDGSFGMVTTFDVVHDTPYPKQLVESIFAALEPKGYWLCEDIKGEETFAENLKENPVAGLLYGFSVMVCMNSGLSEPDGAGLGTLGFTRNLAEKMGKESGFSSFEQLEVDSPLNNYYLLKK